MTLAQFEKHATAEFAKHLPRVLGDEELEVINKDLFLPLEEIALNQNIEVCKRMAWLLVMGLSDEFLHRNRKRLCVPDEYFKQALPAAASYVQERRLGAPARHDFLQVN